MPRKLRTPCRWPMCPGLTDHKTGYCEQHRSAADKRRGSARARGYTYRWEQARILFLREHPLCAECLRNGRVAAATVVDHIVDHKGDHDRFWNQDNWQSLCVECHNRKTMRENGARG